MQTKSTTISEKIDLSSILEEYHEYADVFSKSKVETLAPHHPYDLWIDLEKDSHLLVGTIYLSKFEQKALKEFIDPGGWRHIHKHPYPGIRVNGSVRYLKI